MKFGKYLVIKQTRIIKQTVAKAPIAGALRAVHRFAISSDDGIRGTAAIEFAAIVTALAVLFVAVADVGIGFYRKMQVQNAAQAGAQYAALYGFVASSIANAVTAATSFSGISASPAPSKYCGCPSSSGITNSSCGAICSDGSTPGTYVAVSAQATYATIIPYPLIPNSFTFTSQSTVRIQ